MGNLVFAIATAALPLTASNSRGTAQQQLNVALSCSGTWKRDVGGGQKEQWPYQTGVVVKNGMVSFGDYTAVPISQATDSRIAFSGRATSTVVGHTLTDYIEGSIDRVTGKMSVTLIDTSPDPTNTVLIDLQCNPASQKF